MATSKAAKQIKTKSKEKDVFDSELRSDAVNQFLNAALKHADSESESLLDFGSGPLEKIPTVSTGIMPLDSILGIGGLPRRTIVEIFGPTMSGKTHVALMTCAAATQAGGNVLFGDAEGGFNPSRAATLGIDLNRLMLKEGFVDGEEVLQLVCDFMYLPKYEEEYGKPQPKYFDVIVIDSIAVLGSHIEMVADLVHQGKDEEKKKGESLRPASQAMMLKLFQPRLLRAVQKSRGYWWDTMAYTSPLGGGEPFSIHPKALDPELLSQIKEQVKLRKKVDTPEEIYRALERQSVLVAFNEACEKIDNPSADAARASMLSSDAMASLLSAIDKGDEEQALSIIKKINGVINPDYEKVISELMDGEPTLPSAPPAVAALEKCLNGYIYDIDDSAKGGLEVVHYNPGTLVIVINQIRTGNIGGYGRTTEERPGGHALKFAAGTAVRVSQVKGERDSIEVVDPTTGKVLGRKSRAQIIKSRYTAPFTECEFVIPFTDVIPGPLQELLNLAKEEGHYAFAYKQHRIPKDGNLIKTSDIDEFYMLLLSEGLDYIAAEMNVPADRVDAVREQLMKELAGSDEVDEGEVSNIEYEETENDKNDN